MTKRRPTPAEIKGKLREVSVRYLWQKRSTRRRAIVTTRNARMAALRAAELTRIFQDRYGDHLPDDDAGNADAELMLHHLAHLRDPYPRLVEWIAARTPWITTTRAATLAARIIAKPQSWTADTLAKRLNLTAADRSRLKIGTIGAVDMPKEARATRRRKLHRLRQVKRRHAKGAKRRIEYEANAITAAKPWKSLGISRATWYRHHRS